VADFVGEANLLDGRVVALDGTRATVETRSGERFTAGLDGVSGLAVGDQIRLVVRPESIAIDAGQGLHATVDEVMFSGATAKLALRLRDGSRMAVSIPAGQKVPAKGAAACLSWSPENAVIVS
jgi:ABC-type Fe3+/spermidine/putrescine transport system ATPase subunit